MAISLSRLFCGRSPLSEKALSEILDGATDFKYEIREIDSLYHETGHDYKVFYKNGFGASIIKWGHTFGEDDDLWEVALFHHDNNSDRGSLVYDEECFVDVVGYATEGKVIKLCKMIKHFSSDHPYQRAY